jgi:hypothetical protein
MKKLLLVLLFVPLVSFGQMDYYVSAKGGLNVREAPNSNSKKVATILYGQKVTIESKTGKKLTINDTDKETGITKIVEGEWVKIEYAKTFFTVLGEGEIYINPYETKKYEGYVFNGFLKEASFSQYIKEDYVNLDSMDNIYVPQGEMIYLTEDNKTYSDYFKGVDKPKRLTSCYKYKAGILFSGTAYDIVFSDPHYVINYNYSNSQKYMAGPKINIYIAEFKNGILTGKQKKIKPLEGTETETSKIIELEIIGVEKEIIVNYTDLEIQFGDLKEYIYVNDVSFFDIDGNSISDFPPFYFWVDNNEGFLFDINNKNKFLKIKYFSEYIEPKGEYGFQEKFNIFESNCNLYDIVKEVEVIEDFNVKID